MIPGGLPVGYIFLKRKSKEIRIPFFMQNSKYSFGLKCTS